MINKNEKMCVIGFLDRKYTDLNPCTCGYENCAPSHTAYGMRDYHLIHYVESGSGTIYIKNRSYTATKGQIFIIRAFENVRYVASEDDPWSYVWIGFNGSMCQKLDTLPDTAIDFPSNAFYMIKDLENRSDTREEIATAALFMIFADLFSGRSRHPHHVRRTVDLINSTYMKSLSVCEIAEGLGLDRRYLSRIFKSSMGMSVQDYIIKVRMEQAKRILLCGTSVAQTAEMVGYNDCFNFSKMFKKYVGISPKSYSTLDKRPAPQ